MPQCKKSNCREQAVYGGRKWGSKRYCKDCGEKYYQKQKEYRERQQTLRKCEGCNQALTITRHENNSVLCSECEREQEVINLHYKKMSKFEMAETVDELKEWIREYIIDENN